MDVVAVAQRSTSAFASPPSATSSLPLPIAVYARSASATTLRSSKKIYVQIFMRRQSRATTPEWPPISTPSPITSPARIPHIDSHRYSGHRLSSQGLAASPRDQARRDSHVQRPRRRARQSQEL